MTDTYDKGKLGIAKRDIKKGETLHIPIDLCSGQFLPNKDINFIEGKGVKDLI